MTGLLAIPGAAELRTSYAAIQDHQAIPEPESLALWVQWSRLDPRLAEQMVAQIAEHWKRIPALSFREALLRQPWPQAFGVLAEQALLTGEIARLERVLFRQWFRLILSGVPPAPHEQFFIGLWKFGGKAMRDEVGFATRPYLRWGYFGRDPLVNKARQRRGRSTLLPKAKRMEMLDSLLHRRTRLTVEDYRSTLDGQVGLRQAELDLKNCPALVARGNTRGRHYLVVRKRIRQNPQERK